MREKNPVYSRKNEKLEKIKPISQVRRNYSLKKRETLNITFERRQ